MAPGKKPPGFRANHAETGEKVPCSTSRIVETRHRRAPHVEHPFAKEATRQETGRRWTVFRMNDTVRREELRGLAFGIFVISAFGFVWASTGSSALPSGSSLVLTVSAVVSLALFSAAFYLWRASRFLPELTKDAMPAGTWRRFQIVGIAEGAAIGAAVFVLASVGRPEWTPAAVALIVGIHFFPLASLFRVRIYHITGLLLCAVFALTVILAAASGAEVVWFAVPGLGSALVLWATGAVLAASGLSGIRRSRTGSRTEPK